MDAAGFFSRRRPAFLSRPPAFLPTEAPNIDELAFLQVAAGLWRQHELWDGTYTLENGIQAGADLTIEDGTFHITTSVSGIGLYGDQDTTIKNGSFTIDGGYYSIAADDQLVIDAIAAFGRESVIAGIVISVNIQHRTPGHGHQKAQVFGLQITAGDDEIIVLQSAGLIVAPQRLLLFIGHSQNFHSSPSLFTGSCSR